MKIKEFGYEYDALKHDALWDQAYGKYVKYTPENDLLFRSGRDALKAVAREYDDAIVLMPALSCESMVSPFQMYGHIIRFYKLSEQYAIDLEDVERLIDNERTVLFLYIDYFGKESVTDEQLTDLRERYSHVIFIEDRTHNLLHPSQRRFEPEYVVASLRKWCNIPDGGMLKSRIQLAHTEMGENSDFLEKRLNAQCLRRAFFETGDESIKTTYRQMFSAVSDILDADEKPVSMSAYAYALAQKTDWNEIRACRRENAKTLLNILKECPTVRLIQEQPGKSDLYVAFAVNNRDKLQQELSKLGIFCTIIWPLSQSQINACPVARYSHEHMLAAPCDQRYSQDDMVYIGKEIVRLINEQENNDSWC